MSAPANFAKVDDALWRGALPDADQADWLVGQGIRSVINLELFPWDRLYWPPTVVYYRLPDWEPVAAFDPAREDSHLKAFLAIVRDLPKPVYVHCRDGQNRTGLAVAAYRLAKGDPLDDVLADMERFHGLWEVPDAAYVRSIANRIQEFPHVAN